MKRAAWILVPGSAAVAIGLMFGAAHIGIKNANIPRPVPIPPVPPGLVLSNSAILELNALVGTNRPPRNSNYVSLPPMIGTAISFMPFTNSSPIRYTLKYRTNLTQTNWVEYTNVILDGPPHTFYFLVPDDTNMPQRYFTIDPSHIRQ